MSRWILGAVLGAFGWSSLVFADEYERYDRNCVLESLENQDGNTTIEQLRDQCRIAPDSSTNKSAFERKLDSERKSKYNQFSLQSYHPNYLLFSAYNFSGTNEAPFKTIYPGDDFFDPVEVQFQISLKIPVADQVIGWGDHWFIGYTNHSFWQAYNSKISKPFRETNHQPEGWVSFDNDWNLLGWQNRLVDVGYEHQSNGRSGILSRSWDRAYVRLIFEKDNSAFGIQPWIRLPENGEDENPEIEHYMGNVEFTFVTKQNRHVFSVMARNNFDEKDNKGALQLGYSYPVHRNLNVYVQWFYGYGESLIDYDYKNNTLSLGVQLGSWL